MYTPYLTLLFLPNGIIPITLVQLTLSLLVGRTPRSRGRRRARDSSIRRIGVNCTHQSVPCHSNNKPSIPLQNEALKRDMRLTVCPNKPTQNLRNPKHTSQANKNGLCELAHRLRINEIE